MPANGYRRRRQQSCQCGHGRLQGVGHGFRYTVLADFEHGYGASADNGGTNPVQTGLGTTVAQITPDFSQGTIQVSSNPTNMAIQGNGFFIAQGAGGQQLYTRDGEFKLNAANKLTTPAGNGVLGYGVNSQFQLQTTTLVPLTIPLGTATAAQATSNVTLQGTLSPTGDLATTAARSKPESLATARTASRPAHRR